MVPEILRIRPKGHHSCKRKYEKQNSQPNGDIWESLELYKDGIICECGSSILQKIPGTDDLGKRCFLFILCMRWQGELLKSFIFLSDSESKWPLHEGLRWLKNLANQNESPNFMIDYCQTEKAAINLAFTSLELRFLHWHMFRAMRAQVNGRIKASEHRNIQMKIKSVVTDFKILVYSVTMNNYVDLWNNYQVRFDGLTE